MADDTTITQPIPRFPPCCVRASENIRWHETNGTKGPDEEGWCITLGRPGYGDVDLFHENVSFCPWCGKELPRDG